MKHTLWIGALALLLGSAGTLTAQSLTAAEIIKKAENKLRGQSSASVMKMTIVRPKYTRTMTFKSWSKGEEYALMVVESPARDKGTATLKRGREMWTWQPRVQRVIKMPPSMMSQSWMGSDLTNDDLVRQSSLVNDYTQRLLGTQKVDGRDCYQIELKPRPDAPVVWGKILLWVDKAEFMQLRTEFYDEDQYLVNTIEGKAIKRLSGQLLPSQMIITPADEAGHRTVLEYQSLELNAAIDDDFFSLRNLKRIR